ncbi:hypothetical protein D9M68_976930 [compost metagenome]
MAAILMTALASRSRMPLTMTRRRPSRWMSKPVKNDGANMASTCHWIAELTWEKCTCRPDMCSEDWIISRFMRP